MYFYPISCCSCLWHYSELPTLSPINVAIASMFWWHHLHFQSWQLPWPFYLPLSIALQVHLLSTIIFGLHIYFPPCHWISGSSVIFPPRCPPWLLSKQILIQWHLGHVSSTYTCCCIFPSSWVASIWSPLWHHTCFHMPPSTLLDL